MIVNPIALRRLVGIHLSDLPQDDPRQARRVLLGLEKTGPGNGLATDCLSLLVLLSASSALIQHHLIYINNPVAIRTVSYTITPKKP